MDLARRIAIGVAVFGGCAAARGQHVPLADPVLDPLDAAHISESDVAISGELAYLFDLDGGTRVIHVIGDFRMTVGGQAGQRMSAREGVIWMTPDRHGRRAYQRFEVYLRDDAQVVEPAGTLTTGPVLFVTVSSFGRIELNIDDYTSQTSAHTQSYAEAAAVREALHAMAPPAGRPDAAIRIVTPTSQQDQQAVSTRVFYRSDRVEGPDEVDGRRVVYLTGDVIAFRGKPGTDNYLELVADAGVVFLRREPTPLGAEDAPAAPAPDGPAVEPPAPPPPTGAGREASLFDDSVDSGQFGDVDSIYLEGDIVLSRGLHQIRARRIYYDFVADRALILDAVIRTWVPERDMPLYVRAERIRQLSERQYVAEDAMLTTSEFHTPHYHIGAQRIELIDRTPAGFGGQREAPRSGMFALSNATLNVGGVPVLYWPYIRGDISDGETSIRGVRLGYSGDFGTEVETRWRLFNLLGVETPEGFDGTLNLDYFSERGPAIGADLDYERDNYFGLFKGYAIHDSGEDDLSGRRNNVEPETDNRGRVLIRHRQFLPDDWQLTLEASYISDRTYLEEWDENEFDTGKDQESLLYLKKQRDNWAFTAHAQWRFLDFVTQTERLPELSYRLYGEPVGDAATFFSENRAGWVRYRAEDVEGLDIFFRPQEDSSGSVARADSRQELELPVDFGPLRLTPFASIRGSAWDDTPEIGGAQRAFGTYGVRGSMYLWRAFDDVKSELWDIDGVRHVIKPDFVAWASHTNHDSDELYPFDQDVEGIDEVDGVMVGIRQRWQTHRGEGENRRVVDVVTWDVEVGAFNDADSDDITAGYTSYTRPEQSISRNYINSSVVWRINDATAFASDANFDMNDGELDVLNASLVVERTPRLSYLVGYRFIEESNSNLLGFGANYKLSEKYAVALREEFDVARGQSSEFTIGVIRRFPRWFVIVAFEIDEGEDDIGLSFSLTPEGLTRATIGPRRFTGLAETMQLRPD